MAGRRAMIYFISAGIIAFIVCPTSAIPPKSANTSPSPSRNETEDLAIPFSAADIKVIVDSHNKARASERAPHMPQLTWSAQLAVRAQNWTDQCIFAHQPPGVRRWGENMAAMSNSKTKSDQLTTMFKQWTDEKRYNSDGTFEECCSFQANTCCHYTQVIWAKTTTIGCGYTVCANMTYGTGMLNNMVYMACYYNPAGNVPIVTYDWRPYGQVPAITEAQPRNARV